MPITYDVENYHLCIHFGFGDLIPAATRTKDDNKHAILIVQTPPGEVGSEIDRETALDLAQKSYPLISIKFDGLASLDTFIYSINKLREIMVEDGVKS